MGVLFGLMELKRKRDQLFDKYCQFKKIDNKTQEEKMMMGSLVGKIDDLDDQIKAINKSTEAAVR